MSEELVKKEDALPANIDLENEMLADAKEASGFDNISMEDTAIPFISLLQSGSTACKRGDAKIEGAEEGDFHNTVTNEIYKGTLNLVPCAYKKSYVEWVPRDSGGGFVKEHSDIKILDKCVKNDKNQDVLPNGNHIVTTGTHFCLLLKEDGTAERVVIAFTSTQLKKSRKWNSAMMALMININGKKVRPPMFSHVYKATSVPESNEYGDWSGWRIDSPKMITDPEIYAAAKEFSNDVLKGDVKVTPREEDTTTDNITATPEEENIL